MVDIGTEWNLKQAKKDMGITAFLVDIGTEWNLKSTICRVESIRFRLI